MTVQHDTLDQKDESMTSAEQRLEEFGRNLFTLSVKELNIMNGILICASLPQLIKAYLL